jgi:hypothetical protein
LRRIRRLRPWAATFAEETNVLRRLFSLIIFVAVATGCFWLYRTLTLANPNDEAWVAINSQLPEPVRTWSCQTVRKRLADPGPAPAGCQAAGAW